MNSCYLNCRRSSRRSQHVCQRLLLPNWPRKRRLLILWFRKNPRTFRSVSSNVVVCSLFANLTLFYLGRNIQPKRDLTRFYKWPKYVRLQRRRTILFQRLKVPPTINQFRSNLLDRQTATQLFRLLDKYRPESKQAKLERLRKKAEAKADGKKETPTKAPPVVKVGKFF